MIEETNYPTYDELISTLTYDRDKGTLFFIETDQDAVFMDDDTYVLMFDQKMYKATDICWILSGRTAPHPDSYPIKLIDSGAVRPLRLDNLIPDYSNPKPKTTAPQKAHREPLKLKGKGYSYDKVAGRYRVQLSIDGNRVSFGYCDTEEEAQDRVQTILDTGEWKLNKPKRKVPKHIYITPEGKYRVMLHFMGKFTHFGTFDDIKDAVKERNRVYVMKNDLNNSEVWQEELEKDRKRKLEENRARRNKLKQDLEAGVYK